MDSSRKTSPGSARPTAGVGRAAPRVPRTIAATLALAMLCLAAAPVLAHGELHSTIPDRGSKLKGAPDHIIINFTEPPAKPSVVVVRDGCDDDIIDEVEFEDRAAHVFLDDGEPGRWKVSYEVVSAADGHKTTGGYPLTVKGKANCSEKDPGDDGKTNDKDGDNGDRGTAAGPEGAGGAPDDEGSFPVVPIALASVGVIALAIVARRLSG